MSRNKQEENLFSSDSDDSDYEEPKKKATRRKRSSPKDSVSKSDNYERRKKSRAKINEKRKSAKKDYEDTNVRKKKTLSGVNIFVARQLTGGESSLANALASWKNLSEHEKDKYRNEAAQLKPEKRPATAWALYFAAKVEKAKSKNGGRLPPNVSVTDLMKKYAFRWKKDKERESEDYIMALDQAQIAREEFENLDIDEKARVKPIRRQVEPETPFALWVFNNVHDLKDDWRKLVPSRRKVDENGKTLMTFRQYVRKRFDDSGEKEEYKKKVRQLIRKRYGPQRSNSKSNSKTSSRKRSSGKRFRK